MLIIQISKINRFTFNRFSKNFQNFVCINDVYYLIFIIFISLENLTKVKILIPWYWLSILSTVSKACDPWDAITVNALADCSRFLRLYSYIYMCMWGIGLFENGGSGGIIPISLVASYDTDCQFWVNAPADCSRFSRLYSYIYMCMWGIGLFENGGSGGIIPVSLVS